MVDASVVAPIVIRLADGLHRSDAEPVRQRDGGERLRVGVRQAERVNAGLFALALEREEQKGLVLLDRAADRPAELLAAERRFLAVAAVGRLLEVIQRLESVVFIQEEKRAVENVGAALGDHVHRCAFAAPIGGRKALRRDVELLHRFERKLHHRAAHRAVLVVNAVDGHVHVAAA